MSWDLFVQDWGKVKKLSDIAEDFQPDPIGNRGEIIKQILEVDPEIDFSDPSWGKLDTPDFSIEFNMGEEEEMYSFVMHIRGNEHVVPLIAAILDKLQLKAASGEEDNFFELEDSKKAFQTWLSYKKKILAP